MIQAPHKRLDIHVTHSCQLKCTGCNHYSNYGIHEHFTEDTLVKWAEPWVDRIAFGKIQLVGGEPFLNKELKNICYSYRKLFPNTELLLFTNGLLLEKNIDWLYDCLNENQIRLIVSLHSKKDEKYLYKFKEQMYHLNNSFKFKLVEKTWLRSIYRVNNIYMEVRSVNDINPETDEAHWTITYKNKGKFMKPFTDNNPKQSWKQCIVKNSLQLYKYNLWKCPPIAYLQDVLKKFNLNNDLDWEPYLEYEGVSANITDKKLEEFLYKKEDWICAMCPTKPETLIEKTVL
tara:strand:- start:317 stop:1180 length:864 start_codon:yes stop_codon:yes gene_type:complete